MSTVSALECLKACLHHSRRQLGWCKEACQCGGHIQPPHFPRNPALSSSRPQTHTGYSAGLSVPAQVRIGLPCQKTTNATLTYFYPRWEEKWLFLLDCYLQLNSCFMENCHCYLYEQIRYGMGREYWFFFDFVFKSGRNMSMSHTDFVQAVTRFVQKQLTSKPSIRPCLKMGLRLATHPTWQLNVPKELVAQSYSLWSAGRNVRIQVEVP